MYVAMDHTQVHVTTWEAALKGSLKGDASTSSYKPQVKLIGFIVWEGGFEQGQIDLGGIRACDLQINMPSHACILL